MPQPSNDVITCHCSQLGKDKHLILAMLPCATVAQSPP